ncbi:MAG: regulatory protein RecX [Betaproteobacteria bacterium]|nr:regulatory protein RecX [Betaproteobacteria bacterium]
MPIKRQPLSLKARALQALALREHSASELRRKLLRTPRRPRPQAGDAGPPAAAPATEADTETDRASAAAEVDALLQELQAQGLLSPERFIESRVHARSARFGNRRIQAELAQHGLQLDPDTAQALRASELERARAVWARRYAPASSPAPVPPPTPVPAAEVARQMRFLAARGFSPEVIRRVVKGSPDED